MFFLSSVSKSSYNGNCKCNCRGTCCQAGEMGMRMQFSFPGQLRAPAAGRRGLLHDLGASIATCCPFYTKAACASQQGQALTSPPGRSKQSPGGQWSILAEQSGLEYTKCLRPEQEPWASHVCHHCWGPLPAGLASAAPEVSTSSTALTTTRYSRH